MILVLFCGGGGSTKGVHDAIPRAEILGIDNDFDACATHEAAGFGTLCADIIGLDPNEYIGNVDGLWASPPCTDFSRAGKRAGVSGSTGKLIFVAMDWVRVLRPSWVVFEQVPDVLEYWREFALELGGPLEYRTWVGILNAANYGVPQTRERAFLLATRKGYLLPPEPTHAEHPHPRLDGTEELPWVSMAEALGWGMTKRPSFTVCAKDKGCIELASGGSGQRRSLKREVESGQWMWERPSTTVMGDSRIFPPDGHHPEMGMGNSTSRAVRVTLEELGILQGFDPAYPFKGTKSSRARQIGNSVPSKVAELCVRAVA